MLLEQTHVTALKIVTARGVPARNDEDAREVDKAVQVPTHFYPPSRICWILLGDLL